MHGVNSCFFHFPIENASNRIEPHTCKARDLTATLRVTSRLRAKALLTNHEVAGGNAQRENRAANSASVQACMRGARWVISVGAHALALPWHWVPSAARSASGRSLLHLRTV
jgi:hypothetical protein